MWVGLIQLKALKAKTEIFQRKKIIPQDCNMETLTEFLEYQPTLRISDISVSTTTWANSSIGSVSLENAETHINNSKYKI